MRKQRFKVRAPVSDEMALQITAMADIFTVILLFLLKSYASTSIALTSSVTLPAANIDNPEVEALKLEISQNAIVVEQETILELKDFSFPSTDLQKNRSSQSITKKLQLQREKQQLIAQENSAVQTDSRILIIADQKTPYDTLKTVLASAALTGYTDYKLVVAKK